MFTFSLLYLLLSGFPLLLLSLYFTVVWFSLTLTFTFFLFFFSLTFTLLCSFFPLFFFYLPFLLLLLYLRYLCSSRINRIESIESKKIVTSAHQTSQTNWKRLPPSIAAVDDSNLKSSFNNLAPIQPRSSFACTPTKTVSVNTTHQIWIPTLYEILRRTPKLDQNY